MDRPIKLDSHFIRSLKRIKRDGFWSHGQECDFTNVVMEKTAPASLFREFFKDDLFVEIFANELYTGNFSGRVDDNGHIKIKIKCDYDPECLTKEAFVENCSKVANLLDPPCYIDEY